MMSEENKEVHHYHYGWCCAPWGPGYRRGAIFCGAALIILGVAWLASNMGLITADWWGFALPLLLVVWGIGVLLGGRRPTERKPPELR